MKPVTVILAAGFVAIIAAYGTVKLAMPKNVSPEVKKESVYDRVMRTHTLRCGYMTYDPYLMKDPNTGKLSGIFYDLTEKMGKLLNLKIDWAYETTFVTFMNDAQIGRYDMFCAGLWPEAGKSFAMAYSHPVNYVGLGIYVRADDARFDKDFMILNDAPYRFATLDGEMSQIVKQEDFSKAQELSHPQNTDESQLLLGVTTKKADAIIIERAVAQEFLLKNPGTIKDITRGEPIRVYANTWGILSGEDKLLNMINTAVEEMLNTGYVEKTVKSYEKVPGSFYPVNEPYRLPVKIK